MPSSRSLRPLFGDSGMPIDAPRPARWYLRLMREAKLPSMASPEEALGADLFDHLPEGQEGRRWRALLSEAQVALHQHPLNAQRAGGGQAAGELAVVLGRRCLAGPRDDVARACAIQ